MLDELHWDQLSEVGQTLVHPRHGPLTVVGRTVRTVRDRSVAYLDLVGARELQISVPMDQIDNVGLRPIMSGDGVDEVLGVLRAEESAEEDEGSWSHRLKDYHQRMNHGGSCALAGVVRDVLRASGKNPTSLAERDVLREGIHILATELSLATAVSFEHAQQTIIRTALEGHEPASAAVKKRHRTRPVAEPR